MAFKDLDEFFDDSLSLPVGGKTYVVPGVSAETGLYCQSLLSQGKDPDAELDDDEERRLYRVALGPVYDELLADDVSWEKVKHVGMTAFIWAAGNKAAAEKYWESGGDPEALARETNRAMRRSGSKKKTASGAASTGRKATSTSGTRTPK